MSNDPKSMTANAWVKPNVLETTIEEKRRRKDLKDKRDLLFERYLKQPMDTRMALEIKLIDDHLQKRPNRARENLEKLFTTASSKGSLQCIWVRGIEFSEANCLAVVLRSLISRPPANWTNSFSEFWQTGCQDLHFLYTLAHQKISVFITT